MNILNARASLAQAFAAALGHDFAKHGAEAIASLRTSKVDVYLRLVAAIEPAAMSDQPSVAESMSDEEVLRVVALLDRWEKENPPGEGETGESGSETALQ